MNKIRTYAHLGTFTPAGKPELQLFDVAASSTETARQTVHEHLAKQPRAVGEVEQPVVLSVIRGGKA